MSTQRSTTNPPSSSFQRAIDKFTNNLTTKQAQDFAICTLEDVQKAIMLIQEKRGNQNRMRSMVRMQGFLEAMDQYRKVIEPFLNCTPFLGYVWVTDTWVDSLDILLDAYEQIGESLPSFIHYQALFESDLNMRRALELYYCDILEFHHHAVQFLSRPGWKRLFKSCWKTFGTQFHRILDSLRRHRDLFESEKGTVAVVEVQRMHDLAESQFKDISEREKKRQLAMVFEKLDPPNYQIDQRVASEQRWSSKSGEWIFQNQDFQDWSNPSINKNALLYINGAPGAGKTTLASLIVEWLLEQRTGPVLFFYCKHGQSDKNTFTGILRGLLAQVLCQDNMLASCLDEMCSSKDQAGVSAILEKLAEIAFESQTLSYIILDGLDECEAEQAERSLTWLTSQQKDRSQKNHGGIRLLCVGQRNEVLNRMLSSAISISLENLDHQDDVKHYVMDQAQKIKEEFDISPQLEAEIVRRVTNASKSMFLFARLVMENLSNQTTQSNLIKELEPETFPVDLTAAYLIHKGLLDVPIQHAKMAIFCIRYLLSDPFRLGTQEDNLKQHIKSGYYAFQDYAVLHWLDHLVPTTSLDDSMDISKCLIDQLNLFLENYGAPDTSQLYPSNGERHSLANYIYLIPPSPKDWNQWFNLEWRTYIIRREIERLRGECSSNETNGFLIRELYGVTRFKCSKIKCDFFAKGFDSKSSRDHHVSRHTRPFACAVQHCHFQELGFETKRQLEQHFTHSHAEVDPSQPLFPRPPGRRADNIHKASIRGDDAAVKYFIALGDSVDAPCRGEGGESSLLLAARNSHVHVCKTLLWNGACVNPTRGATRSRRATALHAAVSSGSFEMVHYILSRGDLLPNKLDRQGVTALHMAVETESAALIELLLSDHRVNPNTFDSKGSTVLIKAAVAEKESIIRMLLSSNKVDPNISDKFGYTALGRAIVDEKEKIVKVLLATSQVSLNARDGLGLTPLSTAITEEKETIFKSLLAADRLDPNTTDDNKCSPLSRAVATGNEAFVKPLMADSRVNPNVSDAQGFSALSRAVATKEEAITKLLLANVQIDPDKEDADGRTPLFRAVLTEQEVFVKLLLATNRVNPNKVDKAFWTPLTIAEAIDNKSIIRLLFETGRVDPRRHLDATDARLDHHQREMKRKAELKSAEFEGVVRQLEIQNEERRLKAFSPGEGRSAS